MNYSYFFLFCFLTFSCNLGQGDKSENPELNGANTRATLVLDLNPEQQSAFDALNTLQTNTDEMNRLYSTFANIPRPTCYPADTSILISQSEFLVYMKQFISRHCKNMTPELQDELAATSVLAQKEYKVMICKGYPNYSNFDNEHERVGTWLLPSILGRRDLILKW